METTSRLARVLAALVVVASLVLVATPAETQTPSAAQVEHEAWVMLNVFRIAHGKPALPRHSGLDADARGWSTFWSIYGQGQVWHSPNWPSDTFAHVPYGRAWCAHENVGFDWTHLGYPRIHARFVNSPDHKANMLGLPHKSCGGPDWNRVGVGVNFGSDGKTYITFRFARW